ECGYSWIMGTKPQTLAYALTDSPVGLAAWIIEKFRTWSDCEGDLDAHFSRDVLLTNIMLYWITGAIGSSFWPYYARLHEPWIVPAGDKVMVPTGYAEHPREILTPPRRLAELTCGHVARGARIPGGRLLPPRAAPGARAQHSGAFSRPPRAAARRSCPADADHASPAAATPPTPTWVPPNKCLAILNSRQGGKKYL